MEPSMVHVFNLTSSQSSKLNPLHLRGPNLFVRWRVNTSDLFLHGSVFVLCCFIGKQSYISGRLTKLQGLPDSYPQLLLYLAFITC